MYNEPQVQHHDEEDDEAMEGGSRRNIFGRITGLFGGRPETDEEYEEAPARAAVNRGSARSYQNANGPGRDTFRIAPARESSIRKMSVSSFGDIQKAADCLKAGEPQIINLEKCPAEVSERLIDFLNGVTYALDGYVEKIAEGAYLFTPSHIAIFADEPVEPAATTQQQTRPFFDRL